MSTKSFLPVTAESHFSLANLPYGIFRVPGKPWRAGTAIGDNVVDLDKLEREGLFSGTSLASKEGVFSKVPPQMLRDHPTPRCTGILFCLGWEAQATPSAG